MQFSNRTLLIFYQFHQHFLLFPFYFYKSKKLKIFNAIAISYHQEERM